MLFAIIPFVWIYGFYRIEKLIYGIILGIITGVIIISLQLVLPEPYGAAITWPISIAVTIYFIRKWSLEWNAKF